MLPTAAYLSTQKLWRQQALVCRHHLVESMRTKGTFAAVQGMPTVRSAVRVRPCSGPGRRRTCPVRGQAGSYVVDVALGDTCQQQQVYQHLVAPLVDSFIHGESAVLLVYGAAGTGKTHTLQVSSSRATRYKRTQLKTTSTA